MRRPGLLGLVAVAALAGVLYVVLTPQRPVLVAPGIPEALAADRAARISDLRYDASFTIPAAKAEPVRGALTATFTMSTTTDLIFDFVQPAERVLAARVNGVLTTEVTSQHGHLVVPAALLTTGTNTVAFEFLAGDEALNRQDAFLYTLFVPARASLTLPVFDQPDLKGRWRLTLDLPAAWVAIANGAQTERTEAGERAVVRFAETEPLPTYLVAFAAGQFMVETAERHGRTMRMLHRETDAAKVRRNADTVFDLHAAALTWLEDYTAIPYPFGKFDFVLIPSFQFGGMEHPGAIYYNQASLLLDESATQSQRLGRASLIAHETAHMWFGDLVTMRWFNDVWMKEVFANFMAAKIVNPSFPDVNHALRFLFSHHPAAYDVDRTAGANPIRQPLANLNDAGSLYGAIIYQKAPIVMQQLERLMGEDALREGLREYLARYAMSNATWPDLVALLDRRTPDDLAAWSRAWVEERGRPRVHVEAQSDPQGTLALRVHTSDPLGRGLVWPQALSLVIGHGPHAETVDVTLGASGQATVSHTSTLFPDGPRWILPAGGGLGYGDFVVASDMLVRLAEDLPAITDPLTRGAAVVTLWESMLERRLDATVVRDTLVRALRTESDELNLTRQTAYLQTLFWRFTPATERPEVAIILESLLREQLATATTTSRRSLWFTTLRNIALTRNTVDWLRQVWERQVTIDGLPFSENDDAALAMALALRGVDVLDAQEARITSPDRLERFRFVRPALSADPTVREALFTRFHDVEHRRREAWVLEAMEFIHHPLRAPESTPLIVRALALVREIRDTGDIFFPKRWTDAVLGGHQSVEAAAAVRTFIAALPHDYPERLRWVLEASADPLFRAAEGR